MPPISPLTSKIQDALRKSNRALLRKSQVPRWHLVDAKGYPVGRLASAIAPILRGKHKPNFERNVLDVGDVVVVINAKQIHFTGKKWDQKMYRWHSGYPGGLTERRARDQQRRKPGNVLLRAVKGMLPKSKSRMIYMQNLRIYSGSTHPYEENLRIFKPNYSPLDYLKPMKQNIFSKPAFSLHPKHSFVPADPEDILDDDNDSIFLTGDK